MRPPGLERAVFFNLFAAAEPSANVCVAHGTLCNDPSVYPIFCNKPNGYRNVVCMFYFSVLAEPLAATPGTPGEKHWSVNLHFH